MITIVSIIHTHNYSNRHGHVMLYCTPTSQTLRDSHNEVNNVLYIEFVYTHYCVLIYWQSTSIHML